MHEKFKLKHHVNYFIVLGIFLVFLLIDLTAGLKTSTTQLLTQLAYAGIMAVSLNIVVGQLGELSLGHAGFMCIGAYVGAYVANALWSVIPVKPVVLIIAMFAGGIVAAIAGFIIGIPTLRLKGDYLAITTLAFGEIVRTLFRNAKLIDFGGAMGLSARIYGKKLYIIAFIVLFITVLISQNLQKSRQGRAIAAIRDNEISARAMGVDATYHKLVAFVIAAFFAGVAGTLYAHDAAVVNNAKFGLDKSVEILVMVVLGGMGNITGSILAALGLTTVNFYFDAFLTGDMAAMKKIIYAVVLIVVVIYNNAPALRFVREEFSLQKRWLKKRDNLPSNERQESEPPTTASWDKIPTKIPMDSIISTDINVNDDPAPKDPNQKPEEK